MAGLRTFQQSFNGGEIAPAMYGHAGDAKYQAGLAKCENFLIEPQGPVRYRPGFEYIAKTKSQNKPPRLIPFTFSDDQAMVLELGDYYIRFYQDGGQLLVQGGTKPYEIESPWSIDDVFDIEYVQSADVVTIVHPGYSPYTLSRYGTYDWRLEQLVFNEHLDAPTNLNVKQFINEDVTNPEDYTRKYVVTALDEDQSKESERSDSVQIDCNPYGDGAYNYLSWDAVEGATYYRVYRSQGGIWCYIGQTEETNLVDENLNPDASYTPPIYSNPLSSDNGIYEVTVTNGGSGYTAYKNGVAQHVGNFIGEECGIFYYDDKEYEYTRAENVNCGDKLNWSLSNEQYSGHKNETYPSDSSVISFALENIKIIDAKAGGSGAEFTAAFEISQSTYYAGEDENSSYFGYRTTASLGKITITNPGSGYQKPQLRCAPGSNRVVATTSVRIYYVSLDTETVWPNVYVTDPTGTGASLEAHVTNGVITSISVNKAGSGYTNPTVVIEANGTGGSGAKAYATVASAKNKNTDNPAAVTYCEQRKAFGGSYNHPLNIYLTAPGTEDDMSYHLPSTATDRISKRIYALTASRINHLVQLATMMIVTPDAIWRLTTQDSDSITPDSISVVQQANLGAGQAKPVVANNVMVFAAHRGGHLYECGYRWQSSGYVCSDISIRAAHLFDGYDVTDMTISRAPWQIIWCVSSSGSLVALTYVPDESVGAYSEITTAGNGLFESVCAIPEGEEDALYCVVCREINGSFIRTVERMSPIRYQGEKVNVYLDSYGRYSGAPKTEITGLDWLEGESVGIVADGGVEPDQVVKDGKITLTDEASTVFVGLKYLGRLKTLPIVTQLQDGSFGAGHKKNVKSLALRVMSSTGIKAGPDFDNVTEYPCRKTEAAGAPPDLITDEISMNVGPKWNRAGQLCVVQSVPLPLRITSLSAAYEIV